MQRSARRESRSESEAGFTLIELMMVVLIIAILIAVMIPTFVGAKQRAQDRAMQSSLHNALTAAKVVFSDHGDYTEATLAGATATEPSLTFVAASGTSPGPNVVSVNPASANVHRHGRSVEVGHVLLLSDDESAAGVGVKYAKGPGAELQCERAPRPPGTRVGPPTW